MSKKQKIVIIKYNAGNIRSVYFALQRIGIEAVITDNLKQIQQADKLIFPGVGHAKSTMEYLKNSGLSKMIPDLKQPLLGICLGMQLLCNHSAEGDVDLLGIFDIPVVKFNNLPENFKIPHIGWNSLSHLKSPLFKGISDQSHVYFVHSYYVPDNANSIASCQYGVQFSAALEQNNFFATQFHPEKSGPVGQQILKNFIDL